MRNSVSNVGSVSRMPASRTLMAASVTASSVKSSVDLGRQFAAHALDLGQFFDAGRRDAGDAAEMLEQRSAPFGTDAGDFLDAAFLARFLAAATMTGDCETMRFVANALDQMQRQRFG